MEEPTHTGLQLHCFEEARFTNVKTVLSSANLVFDARTSKETAIERRAEAAMDAALSRSFYTNRAAD